MKMKKVKNAFKNVMMLIVLVVINQKMYVKLVKVKKNYKKVVVQINAKMGIEKKI